MRTITLLLLALGVIELYAQDIKGNWELFSKEPKISKVVSKNLEFKVDKFKFNFSWNNELSYSNNIGYYGGIQTLNIYLDDEKTQTIQNIEDGIGLGKIPFVFYDFNLDGNIDFSVPINDNWSQYYIYNPTTKKFVHEEDWDYLKIQMIDKKNKKLLHLSKTNFPDDQSQIVYLIEGDRLVRQNK
ncbi:XAC2610-related protein [Flagellimonas zhangzhouensis]|uniref:Uncharacterized protein n=1 Tax=Flagellimonas zhangzhouensis TaxID=1073328 RepID=A0A1H2UB22_9FLAO|nr:hypothetical protein [Allomuricauda zhangzhouensis]SDQ18726.1 hypothetical protein SAMN05216294_0780 [Allomuricauda zhangzhouensis]SDW53108.1 hypothetical protein SAMN04487892_1513 [Allomuricauda zhangzhouensis]